MLKENDWIEYDAEKGWHYVMEEANTIGLIKDLFDDIADVVEYLKHKEKKRDLRMKLNKTIRRLRALNSLRAGQLVENGLYDRPLIFFR